MELKKLMDPAICGIVEQLQQAGYEAYIVGGAVRDLLLDRSPKDYDLSTSATPEEIRKVFRDRRTLIIGKRFQLVHLFLHGDIIEISTFRKRPQPQQELHKPGREVPENLIVRDNEFGTAQEDAWRRDFTVNALFYDPVADQILDYTGMGLEDIKTAVSGPSATLPCVSKKTPCGSSAQSNWQVSTDSLSNPKPAMPCVPAWISSTSFRFPASRSSSKRF